MGSAADVSSCPMLVEASDFRLIPALRSAFGANLLLISSSGSPEVSTQEHVFRLGEHSADVLLDQLLQREGTSTRCRRCLGGQRR